MGYKYILFDWDGCLAMSLEVWLDSYRRCFSHFGISLTDRQVISKWSGWKIPGDLGIREKDSAEFLEMLSRLMGDGLRQVELYDGAKELLLALKSNGKKLALVTSSDGKLVGPALEKHGMGHLFDVVLSGDDVENYKPHPEIIEKALARLGGEKGESVIVGDSSSDLGAARNAGIDSILFYPDYHDVFYNLEELKKYKPVHVTDSFTKLEKILL